MSDSKGINLKVILLESSDDKKLSSHADKNPMKEIYKLIFNKVYKTKANDQSGVQ